MDRLKVLKALLVLYALASTAVAVPLLLSLGRAAELAHATSGRLVAASVLSLGFGAAVASGDPWRNRVVVQVLILFTSLAALAVAYRLLVERHDNDPVWALLPFVVAAPLLFAMFYPRPPRGQ